VHRHRARPGRLLAVRCALAVIAASAGLVVVLGETAGSSTAPATAAVREDSAAVSPLPAVALAGTTGSSVAAPAWVTLPRVGVRSEIVPLALDDAGRLVPPDNTATAGWFAEGPAPGAVGPALLVGHVDSWRGPGAFYELGRVAAGDEVVVGRTDGATSRFAVTRVERYPKAAFPTAEVYGPTPDAQLRLITCGGTFDRAQRSYEDNVVVYARLSG
jgi:hypothetical protein